MAAYIGAALNLRADEVRRDSPFEHLGLDSTAAVGMTGDLEEWLGIEIDPSTCYDYPTIESIAAFLTGTAPAAAAR